MTDEQLKEVLTAALLRDLGLRVKSISTGCSDDGGHAAAGVYVDADRSEELDARLDSWSEKMSEQLSDHNQIITVYALARCCGGER